MRNSITSWAGLTAALVSMSLISIACGSKKGGGDPTPTPGQMDLSVTEHFTFSGNENALYGECVGFTITDANSTLTSTAELYMTDANGEDFTVALTEANGLISVAADGSSLTLGGDPAQEDYPCVVLPVNPNDFWPAQNGVRVVSGTQEDSLTGVLSLTEPDYSDLGTGVGSTSGAFERTADFDTYTFTAGEGQYSTLVVMPTDPANDVSSTAYDNDFIDNFRAWDVAIVPSLDGANYRFVTRDLELGGAATGFGYTLALGSSGTLTATSGDDTCNEAGTEYTTGSHYLLVNDLDAATADYDPAGNGACTDRHVEPGNGVDGPGPDTTFYVTLADGESIWVGTGGPSTDTVLYLVPAGACMATPNNCSAAADIFGPLSGADDGSSGTDSLRFTNDTGAAASYHLVLDDFDGTGTGDVYLFMHIQ